MNKIVKLINYNPIGLQTAILNFEATANQNLPADVYTIPRFSYFTINDIFYSFGRDVTFIKSVTGTQDLKDLSDFNVLYQGKFIEYPLYISTGEPFEEVTIAAVSDEGVNIPMDHANIFVFVRGDKGKWQEWDRVDSLYLQGSDNRVFEVRYNENQRYSIKFGNDVTGKRPTPGNLVAVYYLRTDKELGNVGAGTLNNNNLFLFKTNQYITIMNDIRVENVNIITANQSNNIAFSNKSACIPYSNMESAEQVRENAPNFYRQQGRLVTTEDFESYIKTNFSNLVTDIKVVNNWEYLDEHVRYMYNIGLKSPTTDSRALINQLSFADSCNFNNIYIYGVPKLLVSNEFDFSKSFLSNGLKDSIQNKVNNLKMSTVEISFQDPVYMGVGFGAVSQDEIVNKKLYVDIIKESKLFVSKSANNNYSNVELKRNVFNIIKNYFSFKNVKLGQLIDLNVINQHIYNLNAVENIYTVRGEIKIPGISFLIFNPVYSSKNEDINVLSQSEKLPYFKIPYWYDIENLLNQIEIVDSTQLPSGIREY
jgi:hypothetical protein